jgi:serine/threonine-protein kinase
MLNLQGQPILMDFGVAKMLGDTHMTAAGAIIGTAKYMSPEQARGERPDKRTDIYSLGVILYEMVTGHPPFEADSEIAILMRQVSEPVPDIRQIQNNTPNLLVAVIEKALSKEPANRYQSAADMARALRAVDLHPSVDRSPSPSTMYTTPPLPSLASSSVQPPRKTRPPFWVIGSAAVLILLLFGLTVSFLIFQFFPSLESPLSPAAVTEQPAVPVPPGETSVAPTLEPTSPPENLPTSENMDRIDGNIYNVGRDPTQQNNTF